MSEHAHVFVCYSALSLDAARRLARVVSNDPANCHFLILFAGTRDVGPSEARVHLMNPPAEAFSELTRPFATARWFAQWLATEGNTLKEIVAYIPHPLELPGNHFAFAEPRVTRLELLPDGLINYYEHRLEPESLKKRLLYRTRMFLRQLAALSVGLRYEYLPGGHITQYERNLYARTWTENREGMVSICGVLEALPARVRKTTASRTDGERLLLVLDQELHQIANAGLERRMRQRLRTEVLSLGLSRILYKCHPRGMNRHESFSCTLGIDVEDVSGPTLAEELIESRGVTDIVGFYSTPLVLSAQRVSTRVAILPTPSAPGVRRSRRLAQILSALNNTGVRVVPP